MDDNPESRFERIKRHIKENKTTYLVGAGCLTAGYFLRKPQVVTVINEAAPVFNNVPVFNNNNSNVANFGGHLTKMVERVEDGEIWKKVKLLAEEIAEEQDVPFERAQWLLSRHLNGHLPNVYGVEYMPIGVGTTG